MSHGSDKYRLLIENLPDGFANHQIVTDEDGKPVDYIFLEVNPAFEEMTGLKREEIIGKKVTAVLPGIEKSSFDWIGTYGKVALSGEPARFENYSEPLGRFYDISAYSDEQGYFSVFFNDITDRKEAEENLKERVKELNCLELLSDALQSEVDLESLFRKLVDGMKDAWLYPEIVCARVIFKGRQYQTKNFRETAWRQAAEITVQGEATGVVELYYLEERPLIDEGPFFKEERFLINLIARRLGEIIERLQTEEVLRKTQLTVNKSPLSVFWLSPEGQFIYVNETAAKKLGYTPGELLSMYVWDVDPNYPQDKRKEQWNLHRQMKERIVESDHRRRDGTTFPVRINIYHLNFEGQEMEVALAEDISERKAAEKQLQALSDNIPGGVIYQLAVDPEGGRRFTYVSAGVELLGVTQQEALNDSQAIYDRFLEEDLGLLMEAEEQAIATMTPFRCELRLRYSNGEIRWVQLQSSPLKTVDDTIICDGICIDITKKKLAEEELLKFKTAVEQSVDGVAMSDMSGKILFINSAWSEMHGYTLDEVKGCYLSVFHNKEQLDNHVTPFTERLIANGSNQGEVDHTHKDGTIFPTHMTTTIIKDSDGEPFGMLAIARDITERKEVERCMEEEFNLRKALLDNIPNCIAMILKKDTREIVASNRGGYEIGAIPGKTCFQTCALRDDPCPFCRAPEMWRSNQLQQIEVEYRGTWYEGIWAPLSNDIYVHYIFDITARKKIEEALKLQVKERAAVDTFTYSVSNDLQAPLRRIEGFSEMLLDECPEELSEKARDYLTRITSQVSSMKELTEALLQLSKIVSREMEKEPVNLSILTRSCLKKLQHKDPGRRVETVVVPELKAEGDTELLQVMLNNLIENAWKFTSGVKEARIEFGSTSQNEHIVYYLKDNGSGFDMNHAGKLFLPFQKLHREGEYPGIGIGLNLAYRIISRHGGEIWAEGEMGRGACFFFTLP